MMALKVLVQQHLGLRRDQRFALVWHYSMHFTGFDQRCLRPVTVAGLQIA